MHWEEALSLTAPGKAAAALARSAGVGAHYGSMSVVRKPFGFLPSSLALPQRVLIKVKPVCGFFFFSQYLKTQLMGCKSEGVPMLSNSAPANPSESAGRREAATCFLQPTHVCIHPKCWLQVPGEAHSLPPTSRSPGCSEKKTALAGRTQRAHGAFPPRVCQAGRVGRTFWLLTGGADAGTAARAPPVRASSQLLHPHHHHGDGGTHHGQVIE